MCTFAENSEIFFLGDIIKNVIAKVEILCTFTGNSDLIFFTERIFNVDD